VGQSQNQAANFDNRKAIALARIGGVIPSNPIHKSPAPKHRHHHLCQEVLNDALEMTVILYARRGEPLHQLLQVEFPKAIDN
jgi:hypothetical protein